MSNRPSPFEPVQRAVPAARVNQTVNAKPALGAVQASAGSREGQSVQANVTRDDVVRAVMPELQILVRHLVDTSIERALAPLLDKQRELESMIKELRNAQVRADPKPVVVNTAVQGAVRTNEGQPAPIATRSAQLVTPDTAARAVVTPVAHRAPTMRNDVLSAATLDTTPLADIPLELNGSRRKKTILWVFATAVILALASAVVLSVLSNQGTYL